MQPHHGVADDAIFGVAEALTEKLDGGLGVEAPKGLDGVGADAGVGGFLQQAPGPAQIQEAFADDEGGLGGDAAIGVGGEVVDDGDDAAAGGDFVENEERAFGHGAGEGVAIAVRVAGGQAVGEFDVEGAVDNLQAAAEFDGLIGGEFPGVGEELEEARLADELGGQVADAGRVGAVEDHGNADLDEDFRHLFRKAADIASGVAVLSEIQDRGFEKILELLLIDILHAGFRYVYRPIRGESLAGC